MHAYFDMDEPTLLRIRRAINEGRIRLPQREAGVPPRQATLEASRLRLRPILMTSFAFIFGVVPLVIATGAGAEMRRSLGLAVFNGMLGVTLFGIFLTPVFFYILQWLGGRGQVTTTPAPPVAVAANGTKDGRSGDLAAVASPTHR